MDNYDDGCDIDNMRSDWLSRGMRQCRKKQ